MTRLLGIFFIALCFVQSAAMDFVCDKDEVERDLKRCSRVYIIDDGNNSDSQDWCSNIDCLIQCFIDAVGDCTKSDEFLYEMFSYDPQKLKVYFRVACSDVTFAAEQSQAERGCEVNGTLCSFDDISSKHNGALDLYNNGKYEEYKELICKYNDRGESRPELLCVSCCPKKPLLTYSINPEFLTMYCLWPEKCCSCGSAESLYISCATAITRDCFQVAPTENCTDSYAKTFLDLIKISHSLSFCDNKDIKHLYTAHGGDVNCANPKLESKCFKSSVMSRVSRCTTLPLSIIVAQQLSSNITEFCKSQECNIKCYEDAVSQCSMQDQYFNTDPVAVKVSNRAACEKKEELIKAVAVCNMRNMTCYTEFNKSQTEAAVLLQQLNYTAHKHAMCKVISKFIDCVDYNVAGDCTDVMATLMKDMVTVTHSYSKCGPHDHAFFSKYGSDTNCVISGSWKSLINMFLFSVTMVVPVLLYR